MVFDIAAFSGHLQLAIKLFTAGSLGLLLLGWLTGTLGRSVKTFFGEMEDGEVTKFSLLSLCFGVIIGAYWMLRSTKDTVFVALVGIQYLPKAKILTPFILAAVLLVFSMIVDRVKKHRLFTITSLFYGTLFALTSFFWKMDLPMMDHFLINWIPGKLLGWLFYIGVETLGGVIVGQVFWAFVASTTKTESAKKGYPLIFVGAQVGNFLGPAIVAAYAISLGMYNIIYITTGILLLVPIIMEVYMSVVPAHLHESDDSGHKKKKTGALEGLRLIATKPFLVGVAVVSTVYEVVGTIIDYQFKVMALQVYAKEEYATFLSMYAMSSAIVALLFTVLGSAFVVRKFGVRLCLLGYPAMIGVTVIALWLKPSLWGFFAAMIAVKAFSYSLNNPVKELLYLPTSKDVKMKAKGFIDGFGGKASKAVGSVINDMLANNLGLLLSMGSIISLGIVGVWIVVALAVGTKYDSLIEKKEIVE